MGCSMPNPGTYTGDMYAGDGEKAEEDAYDGLFATVDLETIDATLDLSPPPLVNAEGPEKTAKPVLARRRRDRSQTSNAVAIRIAPATPPAMAAIGKLDAAEDGGAAIRELGLDVGSALVGALLDPLPTIGAEVMEWAGLLLEKGALVLAPPGEGCSVEGCPVVGSADVG